MNRTAPFHKLGVKGAPKKLTKDNIDTALAQLDSVAKEFNASLGTSSDTRQVGGDHYKTVAIQPWTAMESWMSPEEFRGFLKGNAIKYLARANNKGGAVDLKKAHHYLEKLLEVVGDE
jgi:Protein of unknwon function (DUF3310)